MHNLQLNILCIFATIIKDVYCNGGVLDEEIYKFRSKALFSIGTEDWGMEELLPIIQEVNEVNENIA